MGEVQSAFRCVLLAHGNFHLLRTDNSLLPPGDYIRQMQQLAATTVS